MSLEKEKWYLAQHERICTIKMVRAINELVVVKKQLNRICESYKMVMLENYYLRKELNELKNKLQ